MSSSDLVVTSVSNPPASALAGNSFSVTDNTTNNGNGTTGASTTNYRFSVDNVITAADSLLTGTRAVPGLVASGNSSGTVTVTIPAGLSPGTYFLGACADSTNAVAESSETNNCLASTTTINVSSPSVAGLVAAYGFNETSGTTSVDASGTGNNGTLTNGAVFAGGKNGNGLSLDGVNDYFEAPETASIDIRGTITISAWINRRTQLTNGQEQTIARKDEGGGYLYHFRQGNLGNDPNNDLLVYTPGAGASHHTAANLSLGINTWHYAAVTYDADTDRVKIYLDGQEVLNEEDTVSGGYSSGSGALTIGSLRGTANFHDGSIDDVRIYNRALTQAEIQADMNTAVGGASNTAPTISSIAGRH